MLSERQLPDWPPLTRNKILHLLKGAPSRQNGDSLRYHLTMRYLFALLFILLCPCALAVAQAPESDDQLMSKARAAYDAPFTRNLAAFDCTVQFDWKEHFTEMFGTLPPPAMSVAEKLQAVTHRVSVDHAHAVVSWSRNNPTFKAPSRKLNLNGS